jgi:hypothetical protein
MIRLFEADEGTEGAQAFDIGSVSVQTHEYYRLTWLFQVHNIDAYHRRGASGSVV